ncbi:alpha/beta-hydrolase [Aulographum hederae CBS 113979]|uniref:Alpha/beta-hydrolase n=1 Tax=Aulographum hederae CBS 113979 TaxID=1176131 RepID=A0A6G1H8P2_9PEZI|nr:alpha/beta-hydrolase [Aulographum hederae CBS 113979]
MSPPLLKPTPFTFTLPTASPSPSSTSPSPSPDLLRQKLALTTFPDELSAPDQWPYGAPLADVKELARFWREEFDFKGFEERVNEVGRGLGGGASAEGQWTARVQVEGFGGPDGGLEVHFVHYRSEVPGAVPLIFVHGWPGSFLEVEKLLPLLAQGDGKSAPAFHVVAPSLPNFGFSEGVKKPGFGLEQYAEVCHNLMLGLGYDEYVTQGGDWGMFITRTMALLYPTHVKASHINMIRPLAPTFSKHPFLYLQHALTPYTADDHAGLARAHWFASAGRGYYAEQSTKPQTIGYALADSPVALLAWIYEKLHDWTDEYPWTPTEILTWVSLYYFSRAGPAASVRIYYEANHVRSKNDPLKKNHVARTSEHVPHVKLGLARFPRELGVFPKSWSGTLGKVVWESENERGGHFAATERPEDLARDLRGMFGKEGPCFRVVRGRSGYVEKGEAKL